MLNINSSLPTAVNKRSMENKYLVGYIEIIYQYYSTFTLLLTWMLAPLTFYVILTQSRSLGSVKWLLLNHSFWCLMLETLLGTVKPVLLGEIAGGYSIGVFRNADFHSSALTSLFCLVFVIFSIGGLLMTIQNRYATIFDIYILRELLKTKNLLVITGILYVSMTAISFIAVVPTLFIRVEQIYQWAREYDADLAVLFSHPTFFMIPSETLDNFILISLSILTIIIILCIISGIGFIYFLQSVNIKIALKRKVQRSVMLSAAVQILLTVFFLFIPVFMFFFYIRFRIKHSTKWIQVFTFMLTSHCFLDYTATLYFVLPYRRFIRERLFIKRILNSRTVQKSYGNSQIINSQRFMNDYFSYLNHSKVTSGNGYLDQFRYNWFKDMKGININCFIMWCIIY